MIAIWLWLFGMLSFATSRDPAINNPFWIIWDNAPWRPWTLVPW